MSKVSEVDRQWSRASALNCQPVRLLHRGAADKPRDTPAQEVSQALAYAVDSFATGALRLVTTPTVAARAGADKGRALGGPAVAALGGTAGFCVGLGKGALGAAVSTVCGVAALGDSVHAGALACVDGVVHGVDAVHDCFRPEEIHEAPPASRRSRAH